MISFSLFNDKLSDLKEIFQEMEAEIKELKEENKEQCKKLDETEDAEIIRQRSFMEGFVAAKGRNLTWEEQSETINLLSEGVFTYGFEYQD